MKKLIFFCVGFVTALGVFFVLWRLNVLHNSLLDILADRDRASVEAVSTISAPNGQYIAATNRVSDRTGWCEIRINVHRKDEPFDWQEDYVCVTGCETRLEQRWQDDRQLNILYSSSDTTHAVKIYQRFWSKDRAVQIAYTFRQ